MQNSKVLSIFIIAIMFVYFLFSQLYLTAFGSIFVYIINPLFFVTFALILKFLILSPYKTKMYIKSILKYIIITTVIYAVIYFLSGLYLTYGKNPYFVGIKGIILNLYSTGLVLFCREYIRFKIVNNVFKKDRKLICILTVIAFTMQDIPIMSFVNGVDIYYIFRTIFSVIIPSIAKNSLFTYVELYTNYLSGFIYEIIIHLLFWLPPILPNVQWAYIAIADILFPIMLLMYCVYDISSKDKEHIYRMTEAVKPKGLIPLAVGMILVIWFAIGLFPIKPLGVATASMEPELRIGDLTLVQKCNVNDIEVGTIIEYKRKNYSVIHRVIEKKQIDGEFIIRTKGDNNNDPDYEPVKEDQIEGRVIAKIPYIAWPAVWIKNLTGGTQSVDIETGK